MQWQIKTFQELTAAEVYAILKLRVDVFVVEQNCPYPEVDGKDTHEQTLHLMGRTDDRQVSAYLRILPPGLSFDQVSIGRVVVAVHERDKGVSRQMVQQALDRIETVWPGQQIKISAQVYLKSFYESFGFAPVSNSYLEDGIPHIDMLRRP
jgi:ElaA protein